MTRQDRMLLAEAALLLLLFRAGLVVLPFAWLRRLFDRPAPGPHRAVDAERVAWAVRALTRRTPGPTTCLAQALTVRALLLRHGHAPLLRIGVRRPGTGATLEAHAWVECDGHVVIGALPDLAEYAVLAAAERR